MQCFAGTPGFERHAFANGKGPRGENRYFHRCAFDARPIRDALWSADGPPRLDRERGCHQHTPLRQTFGDSAPKTWGSIAREASGCRGIEHSRKGEISSVRLIWSRGCQARILILAFSSPLASFCKCALLFAIVFPRCKSPRIHA